MIDISRLLLGLLAIASMVMCLGSFIVFYAQIKAGDTWGSSKAVRLSAAICLHGFGAIPLFLATLLAPERTVFDWTVWLIWATWTIWLVAKTLVIEVSGKLQLAMCLYATWTLVWIAWRLNL